MMDEMTWIQKLYTNYKPIFDGASVVGIGAILYVIGENITPKLIERSKRKVERLGNSLDLALSIVPEGDESIDRLTEAKGMLEQVDYDGIRNSLRSFVKGYYRKARRVQRKHMLSVQL